MGEPLDSAAAAPLDRPGERAGATDVPSSVTGACQAGDLRAQAMRCRRLAHAATDRQAIETLLLMAGEYDDRARRLAS